MPHQRRTFDPAGAAEDTYEPNIPAALRADPAGYYGIPQIAGQAFGVVAIDVDGAGLRVHLRARVGAFLCDLYVHECDFADGDVSGVLRITAGHVGSPATRYDVPEGLREYLPSDTWHMGDGQAYQRRVKWLRHYLSFDCMPIVNLAGRGINRVGLFPTPAPGRFDRGRWAASHTPSSVRDAGWGGHMLGIGPDPGVTGAIEDQGIGDCYETFLGDGSLEPIETRYQAACRWAMRAIHYVHPDGRIVDPEQTGTVYWGGRPWSLIGDQLGKTVRPSLADANGWGADEMEHRFINGLAGAYELTGCPGLQEELRHWAMVYLGSETLNPAWSSTRLFVSRALGWNSIVAAHLWRLLDDRTLADRVRARWIARAELHRAQWPASFWDVRPADGRWVTDATLPQGVMLWQMAVGAFGVYTAAGVLGHQQLRAWAAEAAELCATYAYDAQGTDWDYVALNRNGEPPSPVNYQQGVNAHRSGYYRAAWLPLAVWVCVDANRGPRWSTLYRSLRDQAAATGNWESPLVWFPEVRQ